MKSVAVFSGSSHVNFTTQICEYLGTKPGNITLKKFSNGETSVVLGESVRKKDVFIVQTGSGGVNDVVMEMLLVIYACKLEYASTITAVIPSFPYARQDKKVKSRTPISGKLMADLLQTAGVNHVITMDLHAPQIQGFFNVPVDNLYSLPAVLKWIREEVSDLQNVVIVSPDSGGVGRAKAVARELGLSKNFAFIQKERQVANEISDMTLVGCVRDRQVIIVDDMADTCGTICCAADELLEAGAVKVMAICAHGVLSGNAFENINKSKIETVVVSNTIPQEENLKKCPKLKVIDVSLIFGEAIRRNHHGESVSQLFGV